MARRDIPPRAGGMSIWIVAVAYLFCMAFSSSPAPLWPVYEAQEGYGPATTTLIFAAYPAGFMVGISLLGHVSDRIGRRRTLVPAVLVTACSAGIFIVTTDVAGLLAARILCGLAIGVVTATATAYLTDGDTESGARGGGDAVATGANLGGLALGPLVSGILASAAPAPLHLSSAVFAVVLLLLAVALLRIEESGPAPATAGGTFRRQRIVVPRTDRMRFVAASCGGFAAFSILTLFTSLVPTFLAEEGAGPSTLLTGVIAGTACAAAAGGQLVVARAGAEQLPNAAFLTVPVGILLIVVAEFASSVALFLLAGVVAGAGAGLLFRRMLVIVGELAPADARAEAFAGFFLIVYFNATLPIWGLGVVTEVAGPRTAVVLFASVVLALAAWVAHTLRRAAVAPA